MFEGIACEIVGGRGGGRTVRVPWAAPAYSPPGVIMSCLALDEWAAGSVRAQSA